MVDQERAPVGSVAQEAARLLDALGGWAASNGYADRAHPAGAAGAADPEDAAYPAGAADPGDAADPAGAARRAGAADPEDGADAGGAAPSGDHCQHCGAQTGAGRAVVCGLCPVCQGINLLRSVRPETVDRLADLAGAIAGTLRDLADHRRAAAGTTEPPSAGAHPGGPEAGTRHTGSRVQDIVVDDETTATS
ncbi:hypothetical protein GCM10027517_06520 [Phycicoccus ginsengisoli]